MAVNFKKLQELKESIKGSGERSQWWRPQDGKNVIRILPAKNGGETFFMEVYTHYKIGFDEKTVICNKTHGKSCPICDELAKLDKGGKKDKEASEDMRAKRTYCLQVVTADEPDVVKLYPAPKTVMEQIIDIMLDPDYGEITDVTEGRDITIERTGKGMKTKYSVLPKPKAKELANFDELEEHMVDFDDWDYIAEKSEEEMMKIYNSEEDDEEEEEEDFDEEDGADYDSMSLEELTKEVKKRGIELPNKVTPMRLITLLEANDSEKAEEEDEEEAPKKPVKGGKRK